MSEEKQGSRQSEPVRVVDRRAFTSDGERRPDVPHEEPAHAAPAPTPAPPLSAAAEPARSTAAEPARSTAAEPVGATVPKPDHDPVSSAHFQNLVVNLARQAAANLGAARHPLTGQIEVDLEGAQQMIELLQSLRQKTQGNLTADEIDLLEGLIGDLQMQYVAVRSKAPGHP
jgi:hypothetical protein